MPFGTPTRVGGTHYEFTITGTMTAYVYGTNRDPYQRDNGIPYGFTPFWGMNLACAGAQVGIKVTTGMENPYWRKVAAYAGGGGGSESDTFVQENPEREYNLIFGGSYGTGPPPSPVISLPFSLHYEGLVIKRRYVTVDHQHRSHMHPKDASIADAWYMTPDFRVTASIGSVSVNGPIRKDWLENQGKTLLEIGDVPASLDVWLSWTEEHWDAGADGNCGLFNVDGVDFSRIKTCTGYMDPANSLIVGNGGDLSWWSAGGGGQVQAYGGSVVISPPYNIHWDGKAAIFDLNDPDEALDPVVLAGYRQYKHADGTHPQDYWKAVPYALSQLPDLTSDKVEAHVAPGQVDLSEPLYDVVQWQPANAHVTIDPEWALRNGYCPGGEFTSEGGGLDELMDDSYVVLDLPGCDNGTTGPGLHTVATLDPKDAPLYPLAFPAGHEYDDPTMLDWQRWERIGDLDRYHDPAAPTKPLRWVFPAQALATKPKVGGAVAISLITRYWDRLAVIANAAEPARDWLWIFKTARQGHNVTNLATEPGYEEDLYCWKDYAYLRLRIDKPKWTELTLTITLDYHEPPDITDDHYTCDSWRIDGFSWEDRAKQAVYTVVVPSEADGRYHDGEAVQHTVDVIVDLLLPSSGDIPPVLFVVSRLTVDGLYLPYNADPLKPSEVPQGGRLELLTSTLEDQDHWEDGPTLVRDKGFDATGRDNRGRHPLGSDTGHVFPNTDLSLKETWDYQDDWEGMCSRNDGNLVGFTLPDEPFRHSGPEEQVGYIQRLQHCPTYQGEEMQLDYARPLDFLLMFLRNSPLYNPTGADPAMYHAWLESWWASETEATEVLCGNPLMYWACRNVIAGDHEVQASIRGTSWGLAPNSHPTVSFRKVLGGRIRTLLHLRDRTRRMTPDLFDGTSGFQWVIWRRCTYTDPNGYHTQPPGWPTAGVWYVYKSGTDGLARLGWDGVWTSPGVHPCMSRVWNSNKGTDPGAMDDVMASTYYVQFWASDAWTGFDINYANQLSTMQAHPDYLGEVALPDAGQPIGRMYARRSETIGSNKQRKIDAKRPVNAGTILTRPAALKFRSEAYKPAGQLFDLYSRWVHQGRYPEASRWLFGWTANAGLVPLQDGTALLFATADGDTQVRTFVCNESGHLIKELSPLADSLFPATAKALTGEALVLVVRTLDGAAVLYAYHRQTDTYTRRASLRSDCRGGGALTVTKDGTLWAALDLGDRVLIYTSSADGWLWSEEGQGIPNATRPALAYDEARGQLLVLAHSTQTAGRVDLWARTGTSFELLSPTHVSTAADPVTGAVVAQEDGGLLTFVAEAGYIIPRTSVDGGATWDTLATPTS